LEAGGMRQLATLEGVGFEEVRPGILNIDVLSSMFDANSNRYTHWLVLPAHIVGPDLVYIGSDDSIVLVQFRTTRKTMTTYTLENAAATLTVEMFFTRFRNLHDTLVARHGAIAEKRNVRKVVVKAGGDVSNSTKIPDGVTVIQLSDFQPLLSEATYADLNKMYGTYKKSLETFAQRDCKNEEEVEEDNAAHR
jgi:hypothetical protein